jgi:hypothetical protein
MPRPRILDITLMKKVAKKLGKADTTSVNKVVSRKASKLGISSEAALIILAKELGIGASSYQRRLDPAKQTEVRDALPFLFASKDGNKRRVSVVRPYKESQNNTSTRAHVKAAVEFLIQDQQLKERCQDLLLASSKFDRPINQATLVLEERIRTRAQPTQPMVGESLVGYAFNADLARTRLVVNGNAEDQRGFTDILRGVVPSFRNKTHHHLTDSFTRQEALRVCGFIDVLLRVVDASTKVR